MCRKTILNVVNDKLCCGCGTCISICKADAIVMKITKQGVYSPILNPKKCNNCGICFKVCPGSEVNFKKLNIDIFKKTPKNALLGNYYLCYTGFSKDKDIRYNSSSGGVITQLLIDALEKKIIDGALVTKMNKENPLIPEPFIARSKEEIIESSQSKYCPVPTNMILKEIIKSKNEKFAVVGLPCQIQGIRKIENIFPDLREQIVLHIGIVCNHTPSLLATEFLLKKLNINIEEIKKISYRGKGWPGKMSIITNNKNNDLNIDLEDYWSTGFGQNFFPFRCTLCCDHMAELSDISFADAWLPNIQKKDKNGTSIIIVRNNDDTINSLLTQNSLNLTRLNPSKVIQSQYVNLVFKKINIISRMKLLKLFNKKIPDYNYETSVDINYVTLPKWIFFYLKLYLYQKKSFWKIINNKNKIKK